MSILEKRNIYFIRSNGEYRLLRENVTESQARMIRNQFLDEHNFKSYYTRSWDTDEGIMYDVGSHTEFFLWGFHND